MRTINNARRQEWLKKRGLQNIYKEWPNESWCFNEQQEKLSCKNKPKSITLKMPQRGVDIIFLSNLLTTGPKKIYGGSIFWLSGWGMSCDHEGNPGIALYKKFLPANKHPIDGMGLIFEESEMADQSAAIAIPIIWRWDAYMMPENGNYIVQFSNEEFIDIETKSEAMADEWMEWLSDYKPEMR
jgi:hypothetical protein